MDYDTILVEYLGQFGRYNFKVLGFLIVIAFFTVFSSYSYLFTSGRIPSRCFIPECDEDLPEFAPSWINNAIPENHLGFMKHCARYVAIPDMKSNDTCPASMFDSTASTSCTGNVIYENTNTIVYDFDLGCSEWKRSSVGTIKMLGNFFGLYIAGYLSDRWGRKPVLILTIFTSCLFGISKYWANSYFVFVILEFFEAFLESGAGPCTYILFLELAGPSYRAIATSSLFTCYGLGKILISMLSWKVQNWRYLVLVLYIPQLLVIVMYWLLPESTRWLLNKERYDEADDNIKIAAKTNNKTIPDSVLSELRDNMQRAKKENELNNLDKIKEPWLIVIIFKQKSLLLRCILTPIWWITVTFIYHGLTINSLHLGKNEYLNFIIVAAVDIPGFWSASLLMKWFKRRNVLAVCFLICALSQIGNIFVSSRRDNYEVTLALYLIGKLSTSIIAVGLNIYTAELFPTKYRQSLFSYSSMMGRIGAMVALFTPVLSIMVWNKLPFIIYAASALLSSCLVFLTPETCDINLPDTLEDTVETENKDNTSIS